MIGGLAVNHWADEPMATADVDLVIATERLDSCLEAHPRLRPLLPEAIRVRLEE
jgi:hypothetical protein